MRNTCTANTLKFVFPHGAMKYAWSKLFKLSLAKYCRILLCNCNTFTSSLSKPHNSGDGVSLCNITYKWIKLRRVFYSIRMSFSEFQNNVLVLVNKELLNKNWKTIGSAALPTIIVGVYYKCKLHGLQHYICWHGWWEDPRKRHPAAGLPCVWARWATASARSRRRTFHPGRWPDKRCGSCWGRTGRSRSGRPSTPGPRWPEAGPSPPCTAEEIEINAQPLAVSLSFSLRFTWNFLTFHNTMTSPVLPLRKLHTEQLFIFARVQLSDRVDTQPVKRFKHYKGYAIYTR